MNRERKFITSLHKSTRRNYLARMINKKVECMNVAKKYGYHYWDGNRKYGYGGYSYIPGRWKGVANQLIKKYKLNNKSKILDVGCGKAFLLYEIKKFLPDIEVHGFDISKHAIKNSKNLIKKNLYKYDARKKFRYETNYFNLVISLAALHNFEINHLFNSIKEIERVGRKKYIMVESYRNNLELFNLQCWALTCESFFNKSEWKWIFNHVGYKGDFEFIYF